MPCYEIDGIVPVVDPRSFVHPTAVLIGDVIIGPNCYVGPAASLRGDFGRIVMEAGSNVQDTCVVHGVFNSDMVIEVDGHIGHGAVLHGCRIGRNSLIGMNAVVMDGAVIGCDSLVGAGAFVKVGFCCEEQSLVAGSPAVVIRSLSAAEVERKSLGTAQYQQLTVRCLAGHREVAPLERMEPGRPQFILKEGVLEKVVAAPGGRC